MSSLHSLSQGSFSEAMVPPFAPHYTITHPFATTPIYPHYDDQKQNTLRTTRGRVLHTPELSTLDPHLLLCGG